MPGRVEVAESRATSTCWPRATGWPVVLKAVRGGYDGRGVWLLDGPDRGARRASCSPRARR